MRARVVALVALAAVALASCAGADTAPDPLREGREVYGNICSVCHGSAGEGGVGPPLAAVLTTWPSCDQHIRWVTLGSDGWRAEVGEFYGATNKPIQGGMPRHGDTLTPDQIAAVAAFERVTYGGADEPATLAECGLASP